METKGDVPQKQLQMRYCAANVGYKAKWDGSCSSCRAGTLPLLQNSCGHGGPRGGEWSCSIGVGNSCRQEQLPSPICRVITDPVVTDSSH